MIFIWPWFLLLALSSKSKKIISISVAEVYTTKNSHASFLQNI